MRKTVAIVLMVSLAIGLVGLTVVLPTYAAGSVTRYEQTDSHIKYSGTWVQFAKSAASAGSYGRSSSSNASATITFNGTSVAWIATAGTTLGKAYVSLDGGPAVSINLARSSIAYQQKVWETGTLSSGTHTVKIWRDPSNISGKYISVDALDVSGTLTTTSTTQPPSTTTTTAALPSTTTTTIAAASGTLSVKDYGAEGDGSTDDRTALQNAINAAAAAGKTVYFPAGTYFMRQASVFLSIPSNVTLQGEGDASVLRFQDDGLDKRSNGLQIVGRSNVAIRDLKLMGTQANKKASLQLIRADGTSGLTLDNVTFDGGEYALRTTGSGSSSVASNITVTNCRTLSNVLNPFYFAYAKNIHVSGCNLEANRVDCISGRWPHHFYVYQNVDGLYVSNCTLSGGQHVSITVGSEKADCTNLYFTNIVFNDVLGAIHAAGTTGTYHFDGVTLHSSRFVKDYPIVNITGVKDFSINNFTLTGIAGNGTYLVYITNCASAIFQAGSMTNSALLNNTPKGCLNGGGNNPTYSSVTVS